MKTSKFQHYLKVTIVCMKRIAMDNTECGQLTPNNTYFDYSWFSSVKTAEEEMAVVVDYFGKLKTSHKIVFSYIIKVDERLARRVIFCYE